VTVKQFVAQKSITEMEHPPCSPDLALDDFWLFPEIKSVLRAEDFWILKTYKKNVTMTLKAVQQEFQKCFQQL
jgi:hypothetical protein